MDAALALGALYTLLLLPVAWQDLRTGSVDERLLWLLVLAGVGGAALHHWNAGSLQVLVLVAVIAIVLNRGGWMGGADVTALCALAAAVPEHPASASWTALPFPVSVLMLSLLAASLWSALKGAVGVARSGRGQRASVVTGGVVIVVGSTLGSRDLLFVLDMVLLALLLQYLGLLAQRGGASRPRGEVRFLPFLLVALVLHLAVGDPFAVLFAYI